MSNTTDILEDTLTGCSECCLCSITAPEWRNSDHFSGSKMRQIIFFLHAQVNEKFLYVILALYCLSCTLKYIPARKQQKYGRRTIYDILLLLFNFSICNMSMCACTDTKELMKLETFCSDKKHGSWGFLSLHLSSLLYQYSQKIYCSNSWHSTALRLRPKILFPLSIFTGHLTKHGHRLSRSTRCFYRNRNNCLYCSAIPTSRQPGKQYRKLCYSNLPFTFLKET